MTIITSSTPHCLASSPSTRHIAKFRRCAWSRQKPDTAPERTTKIFRPSFDRCRPTLCGTTLGPQTEARPTSSAEFVDITKIPLPHYEKSMLRDLAVSAFHRAGGLAAARWLNRKGVRILMYHQFNTPAAALATQLAHIRGRYAPLSLAQVADWLTSGAPIPDNACAVTVDDGYRDFFDVAYPLFREYRIPATVYLVSDFLDGKLWLWTDRVRYAFLRTPLEVASMELPDGTVLPFELDSPASRLTGS